MVLSYYQVKPGLFCLFCGCDGVVQKIKYCNRNFFKVLWIEASLNIPLSIASPF